MDGNAPLKVPQSRPVAEAARLARGIIGLPRAFASMRTWPKGNGETVLVIPGFATGDSATIAIRTSLARLGYRSRGWSLGINGGDVSALTPRVVDRIAALSDEAGTSIDIVGWSLGGVLAREATRAAPSRVGHIITLGTPIVGGPKYTLVAEKYREQGLDLDAFERQVAERNREPLPVRVTAVYSRKDAVVAWRACFDDNPSNDVRYVEVETGHAELGFSGRTLRVIADALAERSSHQV